MKWAPLVVFLVVLGVIVVGAGVGLLNRKVLKPRAAARWEAAKRRATWVDKVTSENGRTYVVVQRIAVDGNRREVLDEQHIGNLADEAPDFQDKLDRMWAEALKRVYQLNTGPLS